MKRFLKVVVLVLALVSVCAAVMAEGEIYHALNRVNIRSYPSMDSKILGILNQGDEVEGIDVIVDSFGKPWFFCDAQFVEGYVSYYSLAKNGENEARYYKKERKEKSKVRIEAKPTISHSTITLIATNSTKAYQDGKTANVKAGTKVKAKRFYPSSDGTYTIIKAPNGRNCKVFTKDFETISGKQVPNLPQSVKTKCAIYIGGEEVKEGNKIDVMYYSFCKGVLYAYAGEGYIPVKYLK